MDAQVASTLELAAAGDEVAFARLVDAYHADMVRVAYVVSGDSELARDASQSAWTIAWRKLGTVRDPERVKGWLISVAANEARQMVRRQHRRTVIEIRTAADADPAPGPTDPGAAIDRVDLANALAHLKPEDRDLLALRYVAGLDSFEIAAMRRMSASGVRIRLARLLDRLRKDLDDG